MRLGGTPALMLVLGTLAALGCGGPPADTPSAVILLSPGTVCQGDARLTEITLDGTMSSRHLSLVPLPPDDSSLPDGATIAPLAFSWALEGDGYEVASGSLTSPRLTVRADGARPLHVSLTTTNLAGGSATSLRTLPITIAPAPWPASCRADAACAGGSCDVTTRTCVPAMRCARDGDCAPCFVCDLAQSGCVPRSP